MEINITDCLWALLAFSFATGLMWITVTYKSEYFLSKYGEKLYPEYKQQRKKQWIDYIVGCAAILTCIIGLHIFDLINFFSWLMCNLKVSV